MELISNCRHDREGGYTEDLNHLRSAGDRKEDLPLS